MAVEPGPADPAGEPPGHRLTGARWRSAQRRDRRRRRVAWLTLASLALAGLAVSGVRIWRQVMPRTFSPAQSALIQSWEVAGRWRAMPAGRLFPPRVAYALPAPSAGASGSLRLTARRLEIAPQETCARAMTSFGTDRKSSILARPGCQEVLRATYLDSTGSMVLTVGIVVLRDQKTARTVAAAASAKAGKVSRGGLVLQPVAVPGTVASAFGGRQRQLSFASEAGPYVVLAAVGYADGRPRVPVRSDSYASLEMTSLARGVSGEIASRLSVRPPAPRCPGGPAC